MTKGIRTALWVLSSLAVLWTVGALVMAASMGSMMNGGCPMCGTGGGMMGMGQGGMDHGGMNQGGAPRSAADGGAGTGTPAPAMRDGAMMSGGTARGGMTPGMMGGMMWMMLTMGLAWIVMLGLDAVFVYLVVTALRDRGRAHSRDTTPSRRV